jgi:hypothetical protein
MVPSFWKLCQGDDHFAVQDIYESIHDHLVYVHKDAGPVGREQYRQGEHFAQAPIGDYFYLSHGLHGIYLLGQFTGPANVFSKRRGGWLDRPFRVIRFANKVEDYAGDEGIWAPQQESGFQRIPERLLPHFEEQILRPYFDLSLTEFDVRV